MGCDMLVVGPVKEFTRHMYYHTFHQYLKHTGSHIKKTDNLPECKLDTSHKNVVPELTEQLVCLWKNCQVRIPGFCFLI